MRLLHTADWHLGQLFHEYERTAEHAQFLAWLLDTLDAECVDALLLAGDVFDHANPSAVSQKQLYRFLCEARRRSPHLNIVVVAGNHDSPGRLEAPSPLLGAFDVTVIGQVTRRDDGTVDVGRLCVPLQDRAGRVAAWCLAVPFVRSGDVPQHDVAALGGVSAAVSNLYALGVARLYQEALTEALYRRSDGQAIVALGHCHVEGCAISAESERSIAVGGLDALGRHVFDPRLAYVALGHLHRAQSLPGDDRVRYSGSPLPLSFAEAGYPQQVVCVDLDDANLGDIRNIQVPRFVDLLRVPPAPEATDAVLAALGTLDLPAVEDALRPYLEVRIRLERPEPGLRARIDEALAGKAVRLARIDTTHARTDADPGRQHATSLEDLGRLSPADIFTQIHRDQYGTEPSDRLLSAFGDLLRESDAEERL